MKFGDFGPETNDCYTTQFAVSYDLSFRPSCSERLKALCIVKVSFLRRLSNGCNRY